MDVQVPPSLPHRATCAFHSYVANINCSFPDANLELAYAPLVDTALLSRPLRVNIVTLTSSYSNRPNAATVVQLYVGLN
jgi:hypothetical protein